MFGQSDPIVRKSDVLVVGGGLSAAFAAVKAAEAGASVTLVDKAFFGRSGCSAVASGVMRAFLPGDDLDLWVSNSGGGATTRPFVNTGLLRKVTLMSGDIVGEMEKWGVEWIKRNGSYYRLGSVDVGSGPANVMMEGGGPAMMMAVRAEVLRRGIRVVNRVLINDLLTADGQAGSPVIGAVGMDARTGEINLFTSKTVVMATGPLMVPFHRRDGAGRGRGMPIDLAGDGHAAMLRAGAVLGKLELGSSAIVPWHLFCAPGLEMLMAVGGPGIFVNAAGGKFMVSSDIHRDMRARSAVGLSILREMREGRGPVYLDISSIDSDKRELLDRVIPIVMKNFEAAGFNVAQDRMPYSVVVLSTHSVGGGGAAVNERMATSIPRLYAAGNCTDGAYMSMQQNLTDCAAMGWFAGESAAGEAMQCIASAPDHKQLTLCIDALRAPLMRDNGISYPELRDRIHSLYANEMGMTLDETRGTSILNTLSEFLSRDLPRAYAADPRDACRIHSLRNFSETLASVITAILHRTESRGNVLREDYMMVDNEQWLQYTQLRRKSDGDFEIWDKPVASPPPSRSVERHPFFAKATT